MIKDIQAMIYINTKDNPQLVTVNGTIKTDMELTNNQSKEKYFLDLFPLYYNRFGGSQRKELNLMFVWVSDLDNVPEAIKQTLQDNKVCSSEGLNYLYLASGEYNYNIGGEVNGIMKLAEQTTPTTYNKEQNNIVYNG